jgi:hypothetical protein
MHDLPSPMNVYTRLAPQLVAISLFACAASPAAFAQASPGTLDGRADAAAGRGRDSAQHNAVEVACPSLFDGRGERVLIQRDGAAVGSSFSKDCPSGSKQSRRVEAKTPNGAQRQPKTVERDLALPGLAAGSVKVDPTSARDHAEGTPLAVRVTPGRLSATVLTSGTAIWLLQSGVWTSLLILGLPIWRHVDLLPIVDAASDDEGATDAAVPDADEERAVAHVLQVQGPQQADAAGRRR